MTGYATGLLSDALLEQHASGETGEFPGGRRQRRASALNERDRVVQRVGEWRGVEACGKGRAGGNGGGHDGVARASRHQVECRVDVFDLDACGELDTGKLRSLGELATGGIAPAVVRVVQDEPCRRDLLDGDGVLGVFGVGRGVEDLVAAKGRHL